MVKCSFYFYLSSSWFWLPYKNLVSFNIAKRFVGIFFMNIPLLSLQIHTEISTWPRFLDKLKIAMRDFFERTSDKIEEGDWFESPVVCVCHWWWRVERRKGRANKQNQWSIKNNSKKLLWSQWNREMTFKETRFARCKRVIKCHRHEPPTRLMWLHDFWSQCCQQKLFKVTSWKM